MAGEKDIGKVDDSGKVDRTEPSRSTADDSVIAGDRKHEHQNRHRDMESSNLTFEGMNKLSRANVVDDGSGLEDGDSVTIVSINPETNEEVNASGRNRLTEKDLNRGAESASNIDLGHGLVADSKKAAQEILQNLPENDFSDPSKLLASNVRSYTPDLGQMVRLSDIKSDAGNYKTIDPESVLSQNIAGDNSPEKEQPPSEQLLYETIRRLRDTLADGHLSSNESMDLMRQMNRRMKTMSNEDRKEFIDGFDQYIVGWGKEHNLKTGVLRDSQDSGSIYAIGWGDRTFLNMQAMSGDGNQYPAELVYKSKNSHENKILNDKDGYNCHRTTFELMNHGDDNFRNIARSATMMSDGDLTALGYRRTSIDSPTDLKDGDVLAVPPVTMKADGTFANVDGPFKHSGTVTTGEGGALVVTQKIGAGAKYELIRQTPNDFAGFWTRDPQIQSNPHIFVYRKQP